MTKDREIKYVMFASLFIILFELFILYMAIIMWKFVLAMGVIGSIIYLITKK